MQLISLQTPWLGFRQLFETQAKEFRHFANRSYRSSLKKYDLMHSEQTQGGFHPKVYP
jgi:hypothetical protein